MIPSNDNPATAQLRPARRSVVRRANPIVAIATLVTVVMFSGPSRSHATGDPSVEAVSGVDSLNVPTFIDFGTIPVDSCRAYVDTISISPNTQPIAVALSLRFGTYYQLSAPTTDTLDARFNSNLRIRLSFCARRDTLCPVDTLLVHYRSLADSTGTVHSVSIPITGCGQMNSTSVDVQPPRLDFGRPRADSCVTKQVVVSNRSGMVATVYLSIVGPDAGSFQIISPLPPIATVTSLLTVSVQFCPHPGDADGAAAVLRVATDSTGSPATTIDVPLNGSTYPLFVPASIDFSSVTIGTCRDTTVVFQNFKRNGIIVFDTRVDRQYGLFAVLTHGLRQLTMGDTMSVRVRFCPDSSGQRGARMEVDTSNGGPSIAIDLAGVGVPVNSGVVLIDSLVDFGDILVGRSSIRTVRLVNRGQHTDTLVRSNASYTPPFRVVGGSTGAPIKPGDTMEITIEYRPTGVGLRIGSWTGSLVGSVTTLSAVLRGNGVGRSMWLDTVSARVGEPGEFHLHIAPPLDDLDTARVVAVRITFDRHSILPMSVTSALAQAQLVYNDDSTITASVSATGSSTVSGGMPLAVTFSGLTSGKPTSTLRLSTDSVPPLPGVVATSNGLILLEGCDIGRDVALTRTTRLNGISVSLTGAIELDYRAPDHAPVLLVVLDMMGREVERIRLPEGDDTDRRIALDLAGLPAGTFIIDLRAGSDRASTLVRIP